MSYMLVAGLAVTGFALFAILTDNQGYSLREIAVLGLFCSALMMLSYLVELNAPGFPEKLTAIKFGYLGRVFVNPMLLVFALRYYKARISRLIQSVMYIIPTITLISIFFCEKNQLFYINPRLDPDGLLMFEPGSLYYTYMAFNTVLALIYLTFCLYRRATLERQRDLQNNTLLLGACAAPFCSLLVYLSGWTGGYDTSPLGVMLGAMLIALAILRFGLLDKEEMLQSMATGLVFLDCENRLVYANRKAYQILPVLSEQPVTLHRQDLRLLLSEPYSLIHTENAAYQRRITEWSSAEGAHGRLLTFDDVTEMQAKLNRDAMTGLLNHATFYPMLRSAMTQTIDQPLTVAIADIDSFKRINDNYGHANGDIILIALADTLQAVCGEHGDVFRYGGEEFAVIFRGDYALSEQTMARALEHFSGQSFSFLPYHATFSFGSAEFHGNEDATALFERADQLMYRRKKALHEREKLKISDH